MEEFPINSDNGIFSSFYWRQLNGYREPTRKGTPKGDPIGFSKLKFEAVLLSLTNIAIKKQAKLLNVSYGLLRKWRTEEQFSNEISVRTQRLIGELVEYLDFEVKEKWRSIEEHHPEEETEFYKKIIEPELKQRFRDLELYSSDLLLAIYKGLSDMPLEKLDEFSIFRFYFFLYISESLIKDVSIQRNKDVLYIKKNMFNRLKEMVIYHLKTRYLSDERRILLERFLNLLPGYVGI